MYCINPQTLLKSQYSHVWDSPLVKTHMYTPAHGSADAGQTTSVCERGEEKPRDVLRGAAGNWLLWKNWKMV